MTTHSKRLYEQEDLFNLETKITGIFEQSVKIVIDGKPNQVNALGLIFSETIFHPQGGGQPADKGTINGIPALTVKEDKTEAREDLCFPIVHFLDLNQLGTQKLSIGQSVKLHVDPDFRKQCERSHSAGHLIADILELEEKFAPYQAKATQGHHFPGTEYVKIIMNSIPENLELFKEDLNQYLENKIQENLPVSMARAENKLRHIQIGSSPRMCGGTHVKSTKEINHCQILKIKESKNKESQLELTIFYGVN